MAWELLTEVFGLDGDRLWVTVHESDDEAEQIWIDKVGVPPERIQRMGDEDNFWAMGETGPCGPDSEIFIDKGPSTATTAGPSTAAATASSRCGTSSSCSTTGTRRELSELPRRTSIPVPGWSASCPSSRARIPCSTPTSSCPSSRRRPPSSAPAYGADRRPTSRCACWPTTGAPCPCSWPTACCPPTRVGATCCAASCAAPSWRPAGSGWTSRSARPWCRRPTDVLGEAWPALGGPARPHRQRRGA